MTKPLIDKLFPRISNLKDYEKAITRFVLALIIGGFLCVSVIMIGVYFAFSGKEKATSIELAQNANSILQSNLSEQLSIIATNSQFESYLNEGAASRNLDQVSLMELFQGMGTSSLINGISIFDSQHDLIFSQGITTQFYADLSLCYLGNQLNSQYGNCTNTIRVYLSENTYLKRLQRINPNIRVCSNKKDCFALYPFRGGSFGSFPILQSSDTQIQIGNDTNIGFEMFVAAAIIFVFLMLAVLVSQQLIRGLTRKFLGTPIKTLAHNLQENKELVSNPEFIEEIKSLVSTMQIYEKHKIHAELGASLAQAAHDISSPLTTLRKFVERMSTSWPEMDKIVMRDAVQRIYDIAHIMVSKYKGQNSVPHANEVFLGVCIMGILAEKRNEYGSENVDLRFYIPDPMDNFALTNADPVELKRMLSNLINNAKNAISPERKCEIEVSLVKEGQYNIVTISDNGIGLSAVRISELMIAEKEEHDKIGLGLSHAKSFMASIGGTISMKSELGKGTSVILKLPETKEPSWFISQCNIRNEIIIIIDDVPSVHDTWRARLADFGNIEMISFDSPEEFLARQSEIEKRAIIFCDYEFYNSKMSGIDLLRLVEIPSQKILVTSYHEDVKVINACKEFEFKLLPKQLIVSFHFELIDKDPYDDVHLILIDDSKHTRSSWTFFSDHHGVKIATFSTGEQFLSECEKYRKSTPIYIDLDLQLDKNGVEYAKEIYEAGYHTIYLATGTEEFDVSSYPWIKATVPKSFPNI